MFKHRGLAQQTPVMPLCTRNSRPILETIDYPIIRNGADYVEIGYEKPGVADAENYPTQISRDLGI